MLLGVIVRVDANQVSVVDPQTLDRLHVEVHPGAAAALEGLGELSDDGEHVWLDVDRLRALASRAGVEPGWDAGFDSMVAYAESKGWLDSNRRIRAHIERP